MKDALLLVDVFENVRKLCLKIYELGIAKFLSASGLAWEAALKKARVKQELAINIDVINGWKGY